MKPVNWENPNIKRIRQELNMTKEAFAQLLGVSRRKVHRWEFEEYKPTKFERLGIKVIYDEMTRKDG